MAGMQEMQEQFPAQAMDGRHAEHAGASFGSSIENFELRGCLIWLDVGAIALCSGASLGVVCGGRCREQKESLGPSCSARFCIPTRRRARRRSGSDRIAGGNADEVVESG